jgi:hypothetical protein
MLNVLTDKTLQYARLLLLLLPPMLALVPPPGTCVMQAACVNQLLSISSVAE